MNLSDIPQEILFEQSQPIRNINKALVSSGKGGRKARMRKISPVTMKREDLEEVTAVTKLARQGKISPQAAQQLRDKGLVRSKDQYMKGVEQGTDNILDKFKATRHKSDIGSALGPHVMPGYITGRDTNRLHKSAQGRDEISMMTGKDGKDYIPISGTRKGRPAFVMPPDKKGWQPTKDMFATKAKMSDKQFEDTKPLIKRHEADEIRSMGTSSNNQSGQFVSKKGVVGQHASPKVLKREKELYDTTGPLYGVGKPLKKYRQQSGETQYAKMNNPQIRKVEKRIAHQKPVNLADPETHTPRIVVNKPVTSNATRQPVTQKQHDSSKEYIGNLSKKYQSRGMRPNEVQSAMDRNVRAKRATSMVNRFKPITMNSK